MGENKGLFTSVFSWKRENGGSPRWHMSDATQSRVYVSGERGSHGLLLIIPQISPSVVVDGRLRAVVDEERFPVIHSVRFWGLRMFCVFKK